MAINPNIANNENIYRSQIRNFFEERFGSYCDEGHYLSELKTFRNSYASAEENVNTTTGNYGSFDNIYATKKDVIIGFIEYWLTGGYQRFNRHNKFIINDQCAIYKDTDFTTIYDTIIDSMDAAELKKIATLEDAKKIVRPNWLTISAGSTAVQLTKSSSWSGTSFQYSTDGITWTTLSTSAITISANTSIYLKGNNYNTLSSITSFTPNSNGVICFSFSGGNATLSGSVQSLIYEDDTENKYIVCPGCFAKLFYNCTIILNTPELPATELKSYCYQYIFLGCTALQTVCYLPATILAEHCYDRMFMNCSNLTTIQPLPATTLAPYCYFLMFGNCSKLNQDLSNKIYLPATKLEEGCYQNMFQSCITLKYAPMLPAYKLANWCYENMFTGCTALIQAPELPAVELEIGCYEGMFYNCTSLEIAPELPAKKLTQQCYQSMFYNCTSLKYVKALFTELTEGSSGAYNTSNSTHTLTDIIHNSIRSWLYNTNTSSSSILILHTDFLQQKLYNKYDSIVNPSDGLIGTGEWSPIPTNWKVYGTRNYLHFKPSTHIGNNTNCTSWTLAINRVRFNNYSNSIYYNGSLLKYEYSTQGYDIQLNTSTYVITEFTDWTVIDQVMPFTNDNSASAISLSFTQNGIWLRQSEIDDYDNYSGTDYRRYGREVFNDGTNTFDLYNHYSFTPASNPGVQYIDVFGDMRSIYYTKEEFEHYVVLPNNNEINNYCCDFPIYAYLFLHCVNIRHMYQSYNLKLFYMVEYEAAFVGCTNLIYLPNFGTNPLKPLSYSTFNSAFGICSSLEYMPYLPFLTTNKEFNYAVLGVEEYVDKKHYSLFFYICSSLKYIQNILPMRNILNYTYHQMFSQCSSLERMPEIAGVSAGNSACENMFYLCSSLKNLMPLPMVDIANQTYSQMINNCDKVKDAQYILPAKSIYEYSYIRMFANCDKLTLGPKMQFTSISGTYPLYQMFYNCYYLKYINTCITTSTTSPFSSTGTQTLKAYSSDYKIQDKKGYVYIHNGQFTGITGGYYAAALCQYSKNPETNKYDFDGEYWIYVMSRKFANGETYYIWRKYSENAIYNITTGTTVGDTLYTNADYHLYVVTKECIIPDCAIYSFSYNSELSSITTKYTVVGYMTTDFYYDTINDNFENNSLNDFMYVGESKGNTSPKLFPKVILTLFN